METVRKIYHQVDNTLIINLPDEYKNTDVEVTVRPLHKDELVKEKDLSTYFGRMKWEGDALAEQKKLRDEWK